MQKIAAYEILDTLQAGPRPLYRAKSESGAIFALKTMPSQGVSEEERTRFLREAEITRGLDHPNLLAVTDSGESDGSLFMAMELLDGMDLRKALAQGGAADWPTRLSIMEQVCDALSFAHAKGLVHRDIKPANIFLEGSGRVRVLDFGMARVSASTLTRAGSSVGTLNYMAPEQLRGEACTPATDVFAAAVVFLEMASGKHPFSAGETNLAKVLSNIMFLAAPAIDPAAGAPEGLQHALARALEKDPAKRTQSATEFRQSLAICRLTLEFGAQPVPACLADTGPQPIVEDLAKTRVLRRDTPLTAVAPPPPAKAEPAPPPPPPASPEVVYCPHCTEANPLAATICRKCSHPLISTTVPAPTVSSGRIPAWVWLIPVLLAAFAAAWFFSGRNQ